MNRLQHFRSSLLAAALACAAAGPLVAAAPPDPEDQILVTVGGLPVTATDLEVAIGGSNFSVQFPAMDPDDQAALRGNLLKRLVASRLLYLEAMARGLDQDPGFVAEAAEHHRGLLYRAYMDRLRGQIHIPDDIRAELSETYKDDPSALEPAQTAYIAQQYKILRALAAQTLKERQHLVLHDDRLRPGAADDTVLAEADGLTVRLADIRGDDALDSEDDARRLRDRLFDRAELDLVVRAAETDGLDVSEPMATFARERLPALLRDRLEADWASEAVLRAYYTDHPEIGYVPEIRHVGQIVVATESEAEALRRRIVAGESLFVLAGEHSIDPEGRKQKGDLGWVKEGTGMPAIEAAIKDLKDGEVSPVIATPRGYHLVAIYGRRASQHRPYAVVEDRLRQVVVDRRLTEFVNGLAERFPVNWHLPMATPQ